jgi:predicted branched-subunit amino acid permease
MKKASARQLRLAQAARGRARWLKRGFAAVLWLLSMTVVVIGSLIGIAAWKWPYGFVAGFFVATYATFIVLARRAFPPHRRKLQWWVVAAAALFGVAAFSWFLAFLLVGIAEVALVWLAVSKEDWLPFDASELLQTDTCPECGEPQLHGARLCRICGRAFGPPAPTT